MFAAFGTVTDCSLKFTKEGKFRKFGFVGFKSEEDASRALKHFNKSFVDTSRVTVRFSSTLKRRQVCCLLINARSVFVYLQVEMCKAFGDPTKGKAWSKHTQSSEQDKPSAAASTDKKKVRGHFRLECGENTPIKSVWLSPANADYRPDLASFLMTITHICSFNSTTIVPSQ